jgi:predicted RNA-binding Zn-ribbon protein involved in translation (DUF1610 family)
VVTAAALAVVVFLVVLLANLAHTGRSVPLADLWVGISQGVWNAVGIGAFVVLLAVVLFVWLRPASLIDVEGLSPERTGPHLHVRCRECGVVQWLQDTGERPLTHFCPNCGNQGEYGEEGTASDFLYSEVEVKLGCTSCNTSFTHPEPFERPLYTKCPNCGAFGVIRSGARTQEAVEAPVTCAECGYGFHSYTVRDAMGAAATCPKCGHRTPVADEAGAAPGVEGEWAPEEAEWIPADAGPSPADEVTAEPEPDAWESSEADEWQPAGVTESVGAASWEEPVVDGPPEERVPTLVLCGSCHTMVTVELGASRPQQLDCPSCAALIVVRGDRRSQVPEQRPCVACGAANQVVRDESATGFVCSACGERNLLEAADA